MNLKRSIISLGALPLSVAAIANDDKPNVVFIFADDLAYNCIFNDEVNTPNLSLLRKNSMHFTHAFNQGGYSPALSAASRTMLNTGKYIWDAGSSTGKGVALQVGKDWPEDANPYERRVNRCTKFWSQYMKEAGYTTYMSGKWHVPAVKPEPLFDYTKDVRGPMPNQTDGGYAIVSPFGSKTGEVRKFSKTEEDSWNPTDTTRGGYWKGGRHWSEVLADNAVEYINQASSRDEPYFMYFAFNAPHDPRQAPQEFQDMYRPEDIKVPESFVPRYRYMDEMGCSEMLVRDECLAPLPRTEYSVQVNRKEYFALITHLDKQIGKIIAALEKNGQLDNTYIIFTADHGLSVGEHGLLGKQNMYDPCVRVPFLISGPGIKKGSTCDDLIYLQDAMATAMDIAGSKDLDKVDFKSVYGRALGHKKNEAANEAIYGAYVGMQRMVRTDRYKMIIYPAAKVVRLFDLKKDPNELNDLAADPKYRKVADHMLELLIGLQKENGDQLQIRPYYEAFYMNR